MKCVLVAKPVHGPEQPGQAWREAVQIVPDPSDEVWCESGQSGGDVVPMLVDFVVVFRAARVAEFLQPLWRREPHHSFARVDVQKYLVLR